MDSHYNDLLLSLLVFMALVCLGLSEEGLVPPAPSSALSRNVENRRRLLGDACAGVWNTPATYAGETYTCGARIEYRMQQGDSDHDAKCRVASEIPSVCGACCGAGPAPAPSPGGSGFTIVTHNLYWWNLFGQRHGANFFNIFGGYGPYDIMFFQECDDVNYINSGLGLSGQFTAGVSQRAVSLAWRTSRFSMLEQGFRDVAEDNPNQYYGKRGVSWARLRDNTTGATLWVGSHHGPLSVNTGGKDGPEGTAANIMQLIADTKQSGDKVILAGDFNSDNNSAEIKAIKDTGILDHRAYEWMDQVFTQGLGDATTTIIRDTGSDHRGIKLVFN